MEFKPQIEFVKFAPLNLRSPEYTDEPGNSGVLSIAMRGIYPRFIVYTDNKKDRDKTTAFDYNTMITCPLEVNSFNTFLDYMETIIAGENDKSLSVDCYNTKYVNNVRTNDIVIQATAEVGKTSSGVVYLYITAEGKRKVKFPILPNERFYKFKDEGGNIITDKAVLSKMHATSYLKLLRKLTGKAFEDKMITANAVNNKSTTPATDTSSLKEEDLF